MTLSPVFAFADRFVDEQSALDPNLATSRGVAGFDHLLTDLSPAGYEARAAHLRVRQRHVDYAHGERPLVEAPALAVQHILKDRLVRAPYKACHLDRRVLLFPYARHGEGRGGEPR